MLGTCDPIENDEVCMKMPTVQHLTVPFAECITNEIQELYNMFEFQADSLVHSMINNLKKLINL